ncbi:MAG TPA: alpha/beta fold hydrolase [Bryobacteraceae bacterium]|nr:alpha/beta fold hydrolase [Bryobacteraceae bacterium]
MKFAIVLASCLACAQGQVARPVDRARDFLQLLAKGDVGKAEELFDSQMHTLMPPEKLESLWASLEMQSGGFQREIGVRTALAHGHLVYVTCEFEHTNVDVKLSFDRENNIDGMYFLPYEKPPAGITESEVSVNTLDGTLTLPSGSGPFAAVVLVHGSGINDRDETIGLVAPFRDIAWGLAKRGIAVLRYDKRNDFSRADTIKQEVIDDAVAGVEMLRKMPGIDSQSVFVLGHSLGGMMLPQIAKTDYNVRGLISLAGATRPMEETIIEQARTMGGNIEEAREIAAQMKAVKPGGPPVYGGYPEYWMDLRAYDPLGSAKQVKRPMLFLQGENDRNVTMTDFENWKRALATAKDATFKSYPGLTHAFVPGEGLPSKDYALPSHVSDGVMDDIAKWIRANIAPPPRSSTAP